MLKYSQIVYGPVLVLTLGLISCNKADTDGNGPFKIPQPNWQLENGDNISFNAANGDGGKVKRSSHHLADKLDFSSSPSVSLHVTASCGASEEDPWNSTNSFRLPAIIPLYAMLPHEVLAPDVAAKGTMCSIHFVATGDDGATHTFDMQNSKIFDSTEALGVNTVDKLSEYEQKDFKKLHFYTTDKADRFLLRCGTFEATGFRLDTTDTPLSEFDFGKSENLHGQPIQGCRVLSIKNGNVVSMSAPEVMHFHAPTPKFSYKTVVNKPIYEGSDEFYEFSMTNPGDDTLRFEITAPSTSQFVGYFFPSDVPYVKRADGELSVACSGLPLSLAALSMIIESEGEKTIVTPIVDGYRVELPPDSEATGRFSSRFSLNLNWSTAIANAMFVPSSPFNLQMFQLDEKGQWIKTENGHWGNSGPIELINTQSSFGHFQNDVNHTTCDLPDSKYEN